MRLGVREVAERLGVSEDQIFEWVKRHDLPATQVDGQFRFSPSAVYEWASAKGIPVPGNLFDDEPAGLEGLVLARALRAGGVMSGLKGSDKRSVLESVVARLNLPPHADREVILQMLLAREKMGSTGIGEGFAVPHVRNPIVLRVAEPLVTLFLLDRPIDFGAGDQHPVHSLFLSITPTTRSHLVILARLGGVLQDATVRAAIKERATPEKILDAIERAEANLIAGGRV
ncbi:MAG: PTS sugar transporter subunit IIA [Planctomycetota bacterium]